jgi:serine/threonine protein kinase
VNQALTLPSIGDVVDGKFRIERMLGEGGTSTVYAVRHAITDKQFAIKWLSPELAKNELAVERFIHEAKVCGRYAHPNAVQIYDICRIDESFYLLMELLEGESLETRLKRVKRFSVEAACDILLPCTEALGAAHRAGIVHRDLKPSNIFLCRVEGRSEDVPKVLDFGISKLTYNGYDVSPVTTTTRTVIGTPQYMAPEQMRGRQADPRFDVYALGVVLYELVAGQPPFECDTFADLVFKVLEAQSARLDQIVQADPEFAAIVARAMARDADDRYPSMGEFAQALLPYSSQGKPVERATPAPAAALPPIAAAPRVLKIDPLIAAQALAAETRRTGSEPSAAPAAGPAHATESPSDEITAFGVSTSESEDTPTRVFRGRRGRGLAVALALTAALVLAWQLRPASGVTTATSASQPAPLQPRPVEPSAPNSPSASLAANVLFAQSAESAPQAPPPKLQALPVEAAAKPPKAEGAKPARRVVRARAAKAAASTSPARSVAPESDGATLLDKGTLERSDFQDANERPQRRLALPKAGLSRKDF